MVEYNSSFEVALGLIQLNLSATHSITSQHLSPALGLTVSSEARMVFEPSEVKFIKMGSKTHESGLEQDMNEINELSNEHQQNY